MSRPPRRWRRLGATGAAAAVTLVLAGCGSSSPAAGSARAVQLATADARTFLTADVDGTGRVLRPDQGGDTVSEGQGYALLLADAVGDRSRFARVWSWTRTNLQRPDGLFAYHWSGGRVADPTPAADADVQIAWALDVAASRFGTPGYAAAARRIAAAVAAEEIGYDDGGRPVLAAGPWAVPRGGPVTVEPGYWTPPADAALARLTGDHRWQALSAADAAHLEQLTGQGKVLPADWAQLGGGAAPHPVSAPDGSPAASGQDGLRALVWSDCAASGRQLAGSWWRLVGPTAAAAPLTRSLSGQPVSSDVSPLSAVAAAAAAEAAGDTGRRDSLLAAADAEQRRYPTYYGGAWTALGRVLLTTSLLTAC